MTPKIYYVVIFDSYFKMNMDDWKEAQKTETFTKFRGQWGIWLLVMQIGGGQTAYSTLTVTFLWSKKKKTVSCHRFAYMLHMQCFDLFSEMQVSHRCHNRWCINTDHLSYEPTSVNKDRHICRGIFPTRCKSHAPYKDCLL
jgi:hypothetical protein